MIRLSTAMVVLLVACSHPEVQQGNYQRGTFMVLDRSGKVMKTDDVVDKAIPPSIRILPGLVYEIDARGLRVRGNYRLERDSIFFDDHGPNGQVVVSLFGIASGDTLQLRAPTLLMALGGDPDMDLLVNFIRSPR